MTINYPNGKIYQAPKEVIERKKKKAPVEYGKRGMSLEEDINDSNRYYLERGIAVIHKKPTPIQVVKVDYPKRSAAVIREAYYRHSSTTDFNGIYKGYYIDFEAKETRNKASFPLKNFHEHQIIHMDQCRKMGGITFVLILFSTLNRVFLLGSQHVSLFWHQQTDADKRKSIPLSFIEENGYEIERGFQPSLDYVAAIEKMLQTEIKV